jgi:hypothetical protein
MRRYYEDIQKRKKQLRRKYIIMRVHFVIGALFFCIGASVLSMKGNGNLPMSTGAKIATGIIFLGLLWIPLVRLYYLIFKSKK